MIVLEPVEEALEVMQDALLLNVQFFQLVRILVAVSVFPQLLMELYLLNQQVEDVHWKDANPLLNFHKLSIILFHHKVQLQEQLMMLSLFLKYSLIPVLIFMIIKLPQLYLEKSFSNRLIKGKWRLVILKVYQLNHPAKLPEEL